MVITIPDKVKTIIKILQDEGYEAYVVGGCVRDSVLGRIPNDWDITTNALPQDVKKLFRRTIDVGIEHGTVKVMMGEEGFEITTYRIDGLYEDSRHPSSVEFTSNLREDLRRRDFTINAMAYNDKEGIVDLFGGLKDIEQKVIRAVGDPKERFEEDALRILRAVRFSAQLDYAIEENTKEAIKELSHTLSNISAERIREELEKLLMSDHPDRMRDAYYLGITKAVLPEWDVMMECGQRSQHHYMSVGEHTLYALNDCVKEDKQLCAKDRKILRLTILLHDVAKPIKKRLGEDGWEHFTGHPEAGSEVAAGILRRLKYDNATIADVKVLVYYHDFRPELVLPEVRRLIINVGIERMPILMRVKWIDLAAHSNFQMDDKIAKLKGLEQLYKKIIEAGDCLNMKDLKVNGADLKSMGIESGPKMGEILRTLFDMVIEDPLANDKELLLSKAREMI